MAVGQEMGSVGPSVPGFLRALSEMILLFSRTGVDPVDYNAHNRELNVLNIVVEASLLVLLGRNAGKDVFIAGRDDGLVDGKNAGAHDEGRIGMLLIN